MKIKLDENLPVEAREVLSRAGHEVDTTVEEGLAGKVDAEIFLAAQREGRFLITQDLDFSDTRKFVPGSHHGILLLRLHTPSRRALIETIAEAFAGSGPGSWARCFVIMTERKIRVVRPSVPHA